MDERAVAVDMMVTKEMDGQVRQQHPPVMIYKHPTKPIVVEAQDFQTMVQSLTGGKRSRKAVTFADDVQEIERPFQQEASVQEPAAKVQVISVLDYLDRLDKECPTPSRSSRNRGFFATAGLVKGVRIEDGLQQFNGPASPRSPLSSSALEDSPEATLGTHPCKLVCSTWVPEWTGCLSPRSQQVVKHAQRTALWAASRHLSRGLSESGRLRINLENMKDVDGYYSEADERELPVDLLYFKGEITLGGQT